MKKVRKVGRPTDYSPETAKKFCERISQGASMRTVCLADDMPSAVTIFAWLRENPEFLKQYDTATSERTESQQEIIIELGDKAIEHAEEADPRAAGAVVSAYKLKADNLKWSMSKMKPKKYGDKLDLTTGGEKLPTPIFGGMSKEDENKKHHSD